MVNKIGINVQRVRRRHLLREAEGYLELMTLTGEGEMLDVSQIQTLAQRCLSALDLLEKKQGTSATLFYFRGQVFKRLGRYSQAVYYFLESARLDDQRIETQLALAWCYKRTGCLDLAVAALELALDIDYTSAEVHYNLACYWALADHSSLALKHLGIAIDIQPDFRECVSEEPDFDSLRFHPEFLALAETVF